MSSSAGYHSPESAAAPVISVVVPVYREEEAIVPFLDQLTALPRPGRLEILLVDGAGGSTLRAAEAAGYTYGRSTGLYGVVSPAGRARQLNCGARLASAGALLFLHVDTRLPRRGLELVSKALESRQAGAFDLRFDSRHPGIRMVGMFGKVRSRLTRIPYGDQAHFITRELFFRLGGYPEIALMEDVALMTAVKHRGIPIAILSPPVRTSDRRYRKRGALINTLENWWRILSYRGGAEPERLAGGYRTHREAPPGGPPGRDHGASTAAAPGPGAAGASTDADAAHALFYREPVSGTVKTRLAAEIGEAAALECYEAMLEDLAEKLLPVAGRVYPFVAPARAEPATEGGAAARGGPEARAPEAADRRSTGAPFSPPFNPARVQRGNGLGERMRRAIAELHGDGYTRVVLTGTDLPELSLEILEAAWGALEEGDVVLGPNPDGGYYLIGFRAGLPMEGVFDLPRWGDESVYEGTIRALESAGLRVRLLPPIGDIDTLCDLSSWRRKRGARTHSPRLWNFSGQIGTLEVNHG